MTTPETERTDALLDLVELRTDLGGALAALRQLPWGENEVVELHPGHLLRALRAYQDGAVTAEELTRWADAVEGRDDIGRSERHAPLLNDALLEMSSPELYGDLAELVPVLLRRLEEAAP